MIAEAIQIAARPPDDETGAEVQQVLNNRSFHMPHDKRFCRFGNSGCGKVTLAACCKDPTTLPADQSIRREGF